MERLAAHGLPPSGDGLRRSLRFALPQEIRPVQLHFRNTSEQVKQHRALATHRAALVQTLRKGAYASKSRFCPSSEKRMVASAFAPVPDTSRTTLRPKRSWKTSSPTTTESA